MPQLRKITITLQVLLAMVVLLVSLVWIWSGGLPALVALPETLQASSPLPGKQCQQHKIPVRLSETGWFDFDVIGELCWIGPLEGKTLQVLISGAGYGPVYWNFPYQAETYSYQRAALKAGYATFNYHRLGIGESDHPLGLLLDVDSHAYVLSQIINRLRAEHEGIGPVVSVGHSLGSVTAIAHGVHFPGEVEGIILTGFLHNSNPAFSQAMRSGVDLAPFSDGFRGKIIDPTYMVSKPDTRANTFYAMNNTDPVVTELDELYRQTLTVGEVISMIEYFGPQSRAITVPVLIVTGEEDFVVCGGDLNCRDHRATIVHEQQFFSELACLEAVIVENTNHNISLHKNAPQSHALMLDWLARRVPAGCDG